MGQELAASANYAPTESARDSIKRVRYWHEYVIDLMLAHPEMSQGEIAALLGRSEPWLSRVVNSHMFQELKALRRMEHNQGLHESIVGKIESLADVTLDLITERVVTQGNAMPLSALRETCDMALKAMGYSAGAKAPPGAPVQVHIHQATPAGLEIARARLRAVNTLEGDAEEMQYAQLEELPAGDDYLGAPPRADTAPVGADLLSELREIGGVEI